MRIGERRFTIEATGTELSTLLTILGKRTEADAEHDGTDYEVESDMHAEIDAALNQ